jgi:glutaconate CoA-transferase subunit B
MMEDYSPEELMVIEAARYIENHEVVFAGTGLPLVSTMFAQKSHAPDLCYVVETGPIAPVVLPTPVSVSDSRAQHKAVRLGSLREVLGCILQRGLCDVGFLGGAEIDAYGNINTTVIGDYNQRAKVGLLSKKPSIRIITNLTVMETNRDTGRFKIRKLVPGASVDSVMTETGFDPEVPDTIEEVKPPSADELWILREKCDPNRLYFKKKH